MAYTTVLFSICTQFDGSRSFNVSACCIGAYIIFFCENVRHTFHKQLYEDHKASCYGRRQMMESCYHPAKLQDKRIFSFAIGIHMVIFVRASRYTPREVILIR